MVAQRRKDRLQDHVTGTYLSLRLGIVVIGAGLPVALWLGGRLGDGQALRSSMSAYYYSPTMGDVFVGALVALGAILYLYKGFSRLEDLVLNMAGVCATGVALVPTDAAGSPSRSLTLHGVFAVSCFLCIAYICMFRAQDTLSLIRDTARARSLRRIYRALGAAMILVPLAAVVLATSLNDGSGESRTIFFVEAAGVWVFAAYWLIKSLELQSTGAAVLAVEGKLLVSASTDRPGRIVQIEPEGGWESAIDEALAEAATKGTG